VTHGDSSDGRNAQDTTHLDGSSVADSGDEDRDDDWAWRRRLRANAKSRLIYRIVVGVVGAVITIGGLILIPAPGPGWLVVFLGLAVLASEFEWADRLLGYARDQVGRWTEWAGRQSLVVRLLLGLGTLAVLVGLVWVTLRLTGVPGFVPDGWVPSWSGLQA
jgi:uncharacterized protein (TIGR02611 family)